VVGASTIGGKLPTRRSRFPIKACAGEASSRNDFGR
jgi:hypothetical protein